MRFSWQRCKQESVLMSRDHLSSVLIVFIPRCKHIKNPTTDKDFVAL